MRAPAEGSQFTCETYGEEKVILVPSVHFSLCSPVPTRLLPMPPPTSAQAKTISYSCLEPRHAEKTKSSLKSLCP